VLIKILLVVAVLVVVFVIIVAMQPAAFRVTRAAKIAAPPVVVFEQVNDFHKWAAWSPWEKKDPAMTRSFEGASAGSGAVYRWKGNKDVGEGGMTITDSRPGDLVRIRLEFLKPFAATNTAEFIFKPEGNGQTNVTWSMSGEKNFFFKAFGLFMDMDKMIGPDFEKGLAALKTVAESQQRQSVAIN
jgi:hypothetical protein